MSPIDDLEDDDDIKSWAELPKAERRALRRAAQSQIFWYNLGKKIKGSGPIIAAILGLIALINLGGEAIKEWVTK